MIHSIVYRSEGLLPEADVSNLDILREALERNPAHGVTGFLHRDGRHFLQVLEGPRAGVEATLERIRRDRRHRSMELLDEGPVERRRFGDWSMGLTGPRTSHPRHGIAAMRGLEALAFLEAAARRQAAVLGPRPLDGGARIGA